jgi:asparagine synthase (glutamine-hydrolysing)
MCGIFGIAAVRGRTPSLDDAAVARLRDMLAHRGPDDAGIWRHENIVLAHRRLSVIDTSHAGRQPMLLGDQAVGPGESTAARRGDHESPAPRFALVYNGEIYNDAEVRSELSRRGVAFRSACDTETVLHAWAQWGTEALARLRGMFALAIYDTRMHTLTLARDALGVKPLYFRAGGGEIAFASEVRPLAAIAAARPNARVISAYLTTIRTVLGNETLFEDIYALRPGQMMQCDLASRGGEPVVRLVDWWRGERVLDADPEPERVVERVRTAVTDSIKRQLRADVPMCALLSGGLDSTIVAAVARREAPGLMTFAAGCPVPGGDGSDDLSMARLAAATLGTRHAEAHITRGLFAERWRWMVERMSSPLSTPNEVAIYEVARLLRERGCIVTLSGEGADELFAGYEGPMDQAARFVADEAKACSPGVFQLRSNAWVPPDFKHGVLSERAWEAAEEDRWLESFYDDEFARASSECGDHGIAAHLRVHRRINLAGLLQRLDTATMLAGVEGRTPFADAEVAAEAERLPMALKYGEASVASATGAADEPGGVGVATWRRTRSRTKIVLREAFASSVPAAVLERPKASFPLPFQEWVGDQAEALRDGSFAREVFSEAAVNAVVENPRGLWHLAWPMINIAMWGRAMGW